MTNKEIYETICYLSDAITFAYDMEDFTILKDAIKICKQVIKEYEENERNKHN